MPQPCCRPATQPGSPWAVAFFPGQKGAHGRPECLGATSLFHCHCNMEQLQQKLKHSSGLQSYPHSYKRLFIICQWKSPLCSLTAHLLLYHLIPSLDESDVPPQHADAIEKEGERRRSAGNKRRGVFLNLPGHSRTSEPLEISLGMTITSAIPQPLPMGRCSRAVEDTSAVPAGCEHPHSFPISLLIVRKETKLLSSISLHNSSSHTLFFAFAFLLFCWGTSHGHHMLNEVSPILHGFSEEADANG